MLTETDRTILDLIREGRVDAEIAVRLGLENRQLKARIESLMAYAGVETRPGLRTWAQQLDFADLYAGVPGETPPTAAAEAAAQAQAKIQQHAHAFPVPRAVPTPGLIARLPFTAGLSALGALVVAIAGLAWVITSDSGEPGAPAASDESIPAALASPTTLGVVFTGPPVKDPPSSPSAAYDIVASTSVTTIGGLLAREAVFTGFAQLPDGVEVTVARGTAIDRGFSVERITAKAGKQFIETIYEAPAGWRIADILSSADGGTIAIALCSGCAGDVGGRNGATIDYLVARGRDAEFEQIANRTAAWGARVPPIVAILDDGLLLGASASVPPFVESTAGPLCGTRPAVAVATWVRFLAAFPSQPTIDCGDGISYGFNRLSAAEMLGVAPLPGGGALADWTSKSPLGSQVYFSGLFPNEGVPDAAILRVPDMTVSVARLSDGRVLGYMRSDPAADVFTPVLIDLGRGTYAYLDGQLYADPPHSRWIEVPLMDRPPETIRVIAVVEEPAP